MNNLITRESLSDQVYNHIKRMILSGELQGGERVPEASLSELFGVSRTPLREALKRLSDYGLIYLKPRAYAEVVLISPDEAQQIAELRLHLEELVLQRLLFHGSWDDFDALQEMADRCQDLVHAGEIADALEADSALHLEMARRSGNRYLYEVLEKLDARVQLMRLHHHLDQSQLENYIRQHRIIIEALRNKDSKLLTSVINNHIMHGFRNGGSGEG